MKRALSSAALCLMPIAAVPLWVFIPAPAEAQLAVYDPANHAQNILQAVRALQEVDNQVRQLTHEIDMIEKMARDLETLPTQVAHAIIQDRITRIEDLLKRAEGIGYQVDEVERDYEILYPDSYGETPPASAVLVEAARARWQQSRSAHKHVLMMAAEVAASNTGDADALSGLVTDSQGAVGNLQALQAGNQIGALTAEQLIQIESLMAARYRADAMDEASRLAEATRGRARLKSFLGD